MRISRPPSTIPLYRQAHSQVTRSLEESCIPRARRQENPTRPKFDVPCPNFLDGSAYWDQSIGDLLRLRIVYALFEENTLLRIDEGYDDALATISSLRRTQNIQSPHSVRCSRGTTGACAGLNPPTAHEGSRVER